MFNDAGFESGCEFTSDFCSNIYSRLYLPDIEIIEPEENFTDLIMIQQGLVYLSLNVENTMGTKSMYEFFILPTFSYFGDYQILFDLKSQILYKSGDGKPLITLCLKAETLLRLVNEYPEARKFYMERAWQRRIEFRRMQKKFVRNL